MSAGAIILSGDLAQDFPTTKALNKHFLPIYDKPMIFYSLSIAMLSGIKDIVIVCSESDEQAYRKILGNEKFLGINLKFSIQKSPKGLPDGISAGLRNSEFDNNQIVLGDNFLYGSEIFQLIENDILDFKPKIYVQKVKDSSNFGVVEIDSDNNLVNIIEKPKQSEIILLILYLSF